MQTLLLDIGATYIRATTSRGRTLDLIKKIKHANSKRAFLNQLSSLVEHYFSKKIGKIAISTAGVVSDGKYIFNPNMPWLKGFNIKNFLETRFNVPVFVENDANCFVVAEKEHFYKKLKNVVGITLGSGLGVGLVLNGSLYKGSKGFAGELGHVKNIGCVAREWESLCSSKLLDRKTLEVIEENVRVLIENLYYIFDPDIVIIGGGLGEALRMKNIKPDVRVRVVRTRLKESANLLGALILSKR